MNDIINFLQISLENIEETKTTQDLICEEMENMIGIT